MNPYQDLGHVKELPEESQLMLYTSSFALALKLINKTQAGGTQIFAILIHVIQSMIVSGMV